MLPDKCPWCGCPTNVFDLVDEFYVYCYGNCLASGPVAKSRIEAITRWNEVASASRELSTIRQLLAASAAESATLRSRLGIPPADVRAGKGPSGRATGHPGGAPNPGIVRGDDDAAVD